MAPGYQRGRDQEGFVLVLRKGQVVRAAYMAVSRDQLAYPVAAQKITQVPRDYFAPDASDSANQEVARLPHF